MHILYILFLILLGLGLVCMSFVDYYNGKRKTAVFSGALGLVQFVIVGMDILK